MKKIAAILTLGLATAASVNAQQSDSLVTRRDTIMLQSPFSINDALIKQNDRKKAMKSLLIPGAMITYGFITLGNNGLKNINTEIKEDIWLDNPHKPTHIDNYLMFLPAASVYGLNAIGVHGKNNFKDRTMIFLLSNIIVNATVFSVKKVTHQLRPDGSDYFSFPSGHTAQAFAAAEFIRQEYKDVSPWYGITGYTMAAATGYLRLYNNKHWFNDVVAGAGFGILSTKVAYWIYPAIKRKFFKDNPANMLVIPFYGNGVAGLSLICNFNN